MNLAEDARLLGIEALKTSVLILGLFMSTTMKAAIHMGQSYNENLEVYRNMNFEELQNLFHITQIGIAPLSVDSECEKRLNGHLFQRRW